MSNHARKSMVKRLSWQKIAEDTIKLYEEVIADPENKSGKSSVGKHCF
jgi:glycosyltransferase involved in cell wall biosynthesis